LKLKILDILQEDHANLSLLLDLFESEIQKFDEAGRDPDFELIALALEYCVDYPTLYHHPKEDRVYEKLMLRKPELANKVVLLIEDHDILARLTQAFANAVAAAITGEPPDKARSTGHEFLKHYRDHMDIEDVEIFTAAREFLTESDWAEIESAGENPPDPLFSEQTRAAYVSLRERILQRAKGE
jgi:hemerythrin-like domain-containing protein